MNQKEFAELAGNLLDKCRHELIVIKNNEYTVDDDRLHNFKQAGSRVGVPSIIALLLMKAKHEVSIQDMAKKIVLDPLYKPTDQYIFSKICDDINYNILLTAMIIEMRDFSTEKQG